MLILPATSLAEQGVPAPEASFWLMMAGAIAIGVVLAGLAALLYKTARKQSEMASTLARETAGKHRLEAELELFRLAVDQSPASIVITDTEGNIQYVNPRFCETSGYNPEEVIGGNPRILKSGGLPREYYEAMWHALTQGRTWRGEFSNRRKNGGEYWESASISPVCDAEGNVLHYVAVKEDITLRKHMQDELLSKTTLLQAALENMQHGIIMVDAEGRVMASNRRLGEMLGFAPGFLIGGPDFRDVVAEWARLYDKDERIVQRTLEYSRRREPRSFELQTRDGRFVEVRHNPLDSGGFVRTFTDITSRKQAEALREDMDLISRHDLKTPLNAVIGVPQLLQMDENLTEDQRELLHEVRESGLRMLRMVNLSLDLYKIETGRYELVPEPVDVGAIIRDIMRESARLMERRSVKVELLRDGKTAGEADKCLAWGEELLCYSMLANIVRNAIEASPKDGVVRIDMQGGRRQGEPVDIAVGNKGLVPEDIRERFFDKYVTSGKPRGTGLGTYSARIIAEVQGGHIAMRSSQAEGTTVTVTLPGLPYEKA